ncbi:phospholipase [Mesorhizobium hawassense]|uniref:Phospholipase n=1 Tax=Mesorhizobium hawassense TaxID=1209954 RepID=A0A330HT11_9HYPH|nr:S1/P1 nuclease [Mesorhizobium hawassense]RAZ91836.1 phospholipase [Mesorhizobium hawassense]
MRTVVSAIAIASLCAWSTTASAWWDEGHMQIALMAYNKLKDPARARVDALLRLNPDYKDWILGTPDADIGKAAVMRASVWADDIKMEPQYHDDGNSGTVPGAGDNIGYSDMRMHKYWHFTDVGFTTDNTEVRPADPVNAVTQIIALTAMLPADSGATDELRSYDLVWLLHLIGDAHQPLHATARFSEAHPGGDQGGNLVLAKPAKGDTLKLHAYWDGMFGGYTTTKGAMLDLKDSGLESVPVDTTKANEDNPEIWLKESAELAQKFAYSEPVLSATGTAELTRAYETAARDIARAQAALAAQRLANLINKAFP